MVPRPLLGSDRIINGVEIHSTYALGPTRLISYIAGMFTQVKTNLQGQEIVELGPYRPWAHHVRMGGDSNDYPEHSGRILDLKDRKAAGIDYFFEYMAPKIKHAEAVAVVPSHDPTKGPGGLHTLAGRLAEACECVDASLALVRHTKIAKLASGGDRRTVVHMNSIHIPNRDLIRGRKVLLIDDVMTTGNSMLACRSLLLRAGAAEVKCVALGRTAY